MSTDDIKVGIIGYGLSGSVFHAPMISQIPGLSLCAVSSSRHEDVRRDWPTVTIFNRHYDLVTSPDLDLVVITSPNDTHYELARAALSAGKHVVLEKPMVLSSQEGQALKALAKEQRCTLSVFHNRRWDSDYLTLRRLVEQQSLGPVHTYDAHFDRYRPNVRNRWKEQKNSGGGVLYDLGAHLIDQALCLFGMPDSLLADVGIQRPGGNAPDYFCLRLNYPGLVVNLHSGSLVAEPAPRFQVHGQIGSFIKSGSDPQEQQLKQGIRLDDAEFGREKDDDYGRLTTIDERGSVHREIIPSEAGNYPAYYRQLVAAIRNGNAPPVSATEAINVIRIIEAAHESSQLHVPVSLLDIR